MTVTMSDAATSTLGYVITLTNSSDGSNDSANIVDCTDPTFNTIMVPKDQSIDYIVG